MQSRRHLRLATSQPATLIASGEQSPALIATASHGGLGLTTPSAGDLVRGASVKVQLKIDNNTFEVPGRVVWRKPDAVGVRLQLEIAGTRFRDAYTRWVDGLMARAGSDLSGALAVLH